MLADGKLVVFRIFVSTMISCLWVGSGVDDFVSVKECEAGKYALCSDKKNFKIDGAPEFSKLMFLFHCCSLWITPTRTWVRYSLAAVARLQSKDSHYQSSFRFSLECTTSGFPVPWTDLSSLRSGTGSDSPKNCKYLFRSLIHEPMFY
jgi:hypothetical protein